MHPKANKTSIIKRNYPVAAAFAWLLCSTQAVTAEDTFKLTILHNNDGESALLADGDQNQFGHISRFSSLVKQEKSNAKADNRPAIFLSSGDNFLAGPILFTSEQQNHYYDAKALSLLKYDGICLGNHDFDFGPETLANFIQQENNSAPFISANLDLKRERSLYQLQKRGRIAKSVLINKGGERIGIIGATTEELDQISTPRRVKIKPVLDAIQQEVDRLTHFGINKIILISHLQGISDGELQLIKQLSNVDIVIAGGGDELLANDDTLLIPGDEAEIYDSYPMWVNDKNNQAVPIVTTMGQYRYLGRLIAHFDNQGHLISIDEDNSHPIRVVDNTLYADGVSFDPEMQQLVGDPIEQSLNGLSADTLASSDVALDGLRSHIRSQETNEGDLIADAVLNAANERASQFGQPKAQIAIVNGGGIRNDAILPAGDVSALDTFEMAPFGNFIGIASAISRERLKMILENAVSKVDFDTGSHSGRFAQIAGLSFSFDDRAQKQLLDDNNDVVQIGERIRSAELLDGTVLIQDGSVIDGAPLTIATLSYLAGGGDQYPFGNGDFVTIGMTDQQALAHYIRDTLGGVVDATHYPESGLGRIIRITD